jgi:hypothetical protein
VYISAPYVQFDLETESDTYGLFSRKSLIDHGQVRAKVG